MKTKTMAGFLMALVAMAIGTSSAWAAKKATNQTAPKEAQLTARGRELEAQYAGQMQALKAEISKVLPDLGGQAKSAYLKARAAETAAIENLKAAEKNQGAIARAQGLVAHAKGKWIGGSDKGIAAAKAKLEKATTDSERQAAKDELAKWQKNREEGLAALKERQAALDKALQQKTKVEMQLKEAEEALAQTKPRTAAVISNLGLQPLLSSDKLDAKLAKYVVLLEATPAGLAEFAQQGKEQQDLVAHMLDDDALLVQMALADGANGGKYGQAMKIYSDIRKASDKPADGTLQRLALAVSLEHAVPVRQRNANNRADADAAIDPVKRYLSYEKAFLDGELDPAFKNLSVWDYRMVIDGEEPDEVLAWGREMLRNYRPDQVTKGDYNWRYVEIVRSDIRYGSQDKKCDKDDLHFFQNILMNGGVCGRRAFFGRFILRAFGIPVVARPQRGHAALVHWTPDGWVPCLGAGWGSGWTMTRYKMDLDFLANTQARAIGAPFMQVKRAQWIGDVMGESRTFGFLSGDPDFWYGVSLYTQRGLIEAANAKTLEAVGQDIAEANETKEAIEITKINLTEQDRKIHADSNGVITIPATATSMPTKSTGKIIFMESVLGGKQLHYSRNGEHEDFEYTLNVPAAGRYALTARIVTPSWKQNLLLTLNDAAQPVEIPLPFTIGKWDKTPPVQISLIKGKNVLRFSHKSEGYEKGFSIRDFTLTPL